MIAARWANLAHLDMETKLFCQKLAKEKLVEYQVDLKLCAEALKENATSKEESDMEGGPVSQRGITRKIIKESLKNFHKNHGKSVYLKEQRESKYHLTSNKKNRYNVRRRNTTKMAVLDPSSGSDLFWAEPIQHLNTAVFNDCHSEIEQLLKSISRLDDPQSPSRKDFKEPYSSVSTCNSECSNECSFRLYPLHKSGLTSRTTNYGFVDMDDDEIITMWSERNEPNNSRGSAVSLCQCPCPNDVDPGAYTEICLPCSRQFDV